MRYSNRHILKSFVLFVITLMVMSCTKLEDTPREITVDRDACSRCKMFISDGRFAAAIRDDGYLLFDDIGCLLTYQRAHSELIKNEVWVRDYLTNSWIRSNEATFYLLDNKETPMGYGFVAVRLKEGNPTTSVAAATPVGSFEQIQSKLVTK